MATIVHNPDNNTFLGISDLPTQVDRVIKRQEGIWVKTGDNWEVFKFGDMTPALRLELERLIGEGK